MSSSLHIVTYRSTAGWYVLASGPVVEVLANASYAESFLTALWNSCCCLEPCFRFAVGMMGVSSSRPAPVPVLFLDLLLLEDALAIR